MKRLFIASTVLLIVLSATPLVAVPRDTTVLTIGDRDGDNHLEFMSGEDHLVLEAPPGFRLRKPRSILNFLQMSDFQIIDEESPARVEFLDGSQRPTAGSPSGPFASGYRPHDSLSTQIQEAMVRAARNTTSPITSARLQLTILTGDNADSQQYNETRWFIDILDGKKRIDPNSGIPTALCEATPGSIYDGVRGGGVTGATDNGYYEPDSSGANSDGDGYSPDANVNRAETGGSGGRSVVLRDFPGLFEAANHPFLALGIDMPWYSAFGNHDALIQGNSPEAYGGPTGPSGETYNPTFQRIATGCAKPIVPLGTLTAEELAQLVADPIGFVATHPGAAEIVPPDERRCFLAKEKPIGNPHAPCATHGWIEQHFYTTGTPVGHGFAQRPSEAVANHDGYYAFSPRKGMRFAVLDTITDECSVVVCAEGSVDDEQYDWLDDQMGQAASMGQYVMVFSHHTLRTTRFPSTDPTESPLHYGQRRDPMNQFNPQHPASESLVDLYCRYPNMLAHIAGHEHENYVFHYNCDGNQAMEVAGPGDFWHISTAAHLDWPQQARMIELIDNGNGTISLALTMLDHDGPPEPGGAPASLTARGTAGEQVLKLASIGRELGYNDYQHSHGARGGEPEDGNRNVIIYLDHPWPYPTITTP